MYIDLNLLVLNHMESNNWENGYCYLCMEGINSEIQLEKDRAN